MYIVDKEERRHLVASYERYEEQIIIRTPHHSITVVCDTIESARFLLRSLDENSSGSRGVFVLPPKMEQRIAWL
jgi:hypothetical protein